MQKQSLILNNQYRNMQLYRKRVTHNDTLHHIYATASNDLFISVCRLNFWDNNYPKLNYPIITLFNDVSR